MSSTSLGFSVMHTRSKISRALLIEFSLPLEKAGYDHHQQREHLWSDYALGGRAGHNDFLNDRIYHLTRMMKITRNGVILRGCHGPCVLSHDGLESKRVCRIVLNTGWFFRPRGTACNTVEDELSP
jgi:hypothetical protein